MLERLIESAIQNFSLTDLLVFSSLFVFLYNTFILNRKVTHQKGDIANLKATQDKLIERIESKSNSTIEFVVAVTESFYKYGLISLGKNSKITGYLKPGNAITVIYDKNEYHGKVHSSVAGRIDGLTKLYKEHPELKERGSLEIKCMLKQNEITQITVL